MDDDRGTMAVEPPSEINLEDILANLLVPDNAVIKQVKWEGILVLTSSGVECCLFSGCGSEMAPRTGHLVNVRT